MLTVGQERLLKLAAFLEELPEEQFAIEYYVSQSDAQGCGTVCCAIGWCPKVFPENWGWRGIFCGKSNLLNSRYPQRRDYDELSAIAGSIKEQVQDFFDLNGTTVRKLFFAGYGLKHDAKPIQVATRIRKYVREGRI